MRKISKIFAVIMLVALLATLFCVPVFAAGEVSTAIEGTWNAAKTEVKTVVNNVVFPVLDLVLAVFFFVKLGGSYFEYRKHGQFEIVGPAILFACLIFTLTARHISGQFWGCSGSFCSMQYAPSKSLYFQHIGSI